jgi:hypothetical protein
MSASAGLRNCCECNIIVKMGEKTIRCAGLCANKFHWDCVKNDIIIDYESFKDSANLKWLCNSCLETSEMTSNICLNEIHKISETADKQASSLASMYQKIDELKLIITTLSIEVGELQLNNENMYGRMNSSSKKSKSKQKNSTSYAETLHKKLKTQKSETARKSLKKHTSSKKPSTAAALEDKKDGQTVNHVTDEAEQSADQDVNKTHPPSAEANKQDDKIQSESDSTTNSDSDDSDSSLKNFSKVLTKNQRKKSVQKAPVTPVSVKKVPVKKDIKVGNNANAANFKFTAAPRKCWIYLSKLSATTEISNINDYLISKFPNKTFIIEEVEIQNKNRKAFKIGAEYELMDAMYDITNWPMGVQIDRYRFPKNLKKT